MAAEKTHTDANYAEAATSGGLPQLDFSSWAGQIFWLVITFGILYFVLAHFILPRLAGGLAERSDKIADDLDMASNLQRQAEEAEKAYTQSLADARAQAHNVVESTRQAVEAEINTEIETADAEMARQSDAAETKIRKMREAAMTNIESIAIVAAEDVVKALTGKTVTAAKIKSALRKV